MARRGGKKPSAEDKALWKAVTETTQPLADHARNLATQFDDFLREATAEASHTVQNDPWHGRSKKPAPVHQPPPPPRHTPQAEQIPIDDRTHRKLARGRLPVDRRLDLHGMTQSQARALLLDELQLAQWSGAKLLLVITGKGDRGQGILRQNVPRWLSAPPFSTMVSGVRPAAPRHGGDGALYVRVRRRKGQEQ